MTQPPDNSDRRQPETRSRARANAALLGAFCLAAVVIYLLAGPRSDQVNGRTEIVYWHGWAGKEFKPLQKIIDDYNRAHSNVFVKPTYVGAGYQKMRIAFAGGDTPDVCSSVWVEDIPDYAERGALTPLDDFIASSTRRLDDYPPPIQECYRYNGKTYALSMSVSAIFVAYNKQVFRESGLDPERPPRTLEEFDRAAEACTRFRNGRREDGIERLGFPYGGLIYWANAFNVEFWNQQTRQTGIDSPRMIECVNWMKSNVDKYGFQAQRSFASTFGNLLSPNNPFISGKIAMAIVGDWYTEIIKIYAPPGFEWGWFPIPAPPDGRTSSTLLDASMFVIPSACRHKREAWDFIEYITSPVGQLGFKTGKEPSALAATKTVQADPLFQTPYWNFVKELASGPNAISIKTPLYNKFLFLLNRIEDQTLSGALPPAQALKEARDAYTEAVAEVLRK